MKDKLRDIIREIVLEEMEEAKQGRISNNFVIVNAEKANKLKEIFANSNTHKWIADMIDIIMEAGETGVDRKSLVNALKGSNSDYKLSTLNDETRSLVKSGVLSLGGLSRPKVERPATSGKRGRPARPASEEDTVMEEAPLNESFIRMKKLAGI